MRRWAVLLFLGLFFLFAAGEVQTIVVVEEPSAAKAVDMIRTGALDLFAAGVAEPTLIRKIRTEPTLACSLTYNAVWHLSFNPFGPLFSDGRLNPFADPRVREAMNWLVNRDHVVQEILGGAGLPQVLPLRPIFPDYARLAQYARPLELRYSWDPGRGREALAEAMRALGAELAGGRWLYRGHPVEIRLLIRTDARRPLGDYVAGLLEDLGFSVTPLYVTHAEALRILSAPPEEGRWHLFTNSLVVSLIERDEAATFELNYTPVFPYPPWQYLRPEPALAALARRLARGDYRSFSEREALMAQALELAMRDSSQVWLAVRAACYPHAADLELTVDLGAGLATGLWARTLRAPREVIRMAMPALFTAPLNPVAGSFTVHDQTLIRAIADAALLPHPYSGLYLPVDLRRAQVAVREDWVLQKSTDWVELEYVPEIPVPEEAWLSWDTKDQRFLTVGELFPQGLFAGARVTLAFRPDLWERTWHDGSPFSLGDFLLRLILLFDRAQPGSPFYDESAVPAHEAFRGHFRGILMRSVDPLVVEVYTDLRFLDAEWLVAKAAELFYPSYERGPGPWHVLALLLWAEEKGKLALSQSKARALGVEWANLVAGPSLAVLGEALRDAEENSFVPYAGFLRRYLSAQEVDARYAALRKFYEEHGHFLVGNGPFSLKLVKPVEKVAVLGRWPPYSVPSGAELPRPAIPWVQIQGPSVVPLSAGARFLISLGHGDEALTPEDVLFVKYLVFDAQNELVAWGLVEPPFAVELGPEVLGEMGVGPARLEVVVLARGTAFSAWTAMPFVVVEAGG